MTKKAKMSQAHKEKHPSSLALTQSQINHSHSKKLLKLDKDSFNNLGCSSSPPHLECFKRTFNLHKKVESEEQINIFNRKYHQEVKC